MATKSENKFAELAYCQVNKITKAEVKKPEHQQIIQNALKELWAYEGLYPSETEAQKEHRLDLESEVEEGNAWGLSVHFKELYPEELETVTGWSVIFQMYNKLIGHKVGDVSTADTEKDEAVAVPTEVSSENKNNKLKEAKDMAKENVMENENTKAQENLKTLENLEQNLNTSGYAKDTDVKTDENLPASGNMKAAYSAAQEKYKNQRVDREAFMKNSKVTELVLSSDSAENIAVNGKEAKGTLKDYDKAYADFCTKTGLTHDEAGNPTFPNVPEAHKEAALVMYNALKEAKEDKAKEFDVYFSKSTKPIKGFKFMDAKGGAGSYMSIQQITDLILEKSLGLLNTPVAGVQIQLHKTEPKTNKKTGSKGKGTAKTTGAKKGYQGIVSVRISDRNTAMEKMKSYWKEIIKSETVVADGFKSDLALKYYGEPNEDNERKVLTWRLPLNVLQYKLEITDEAKKALGDGSRSVGKQTAAINIADEKAMKKLLDDMIAVTAQAAQRGLGGESSVFAEIRSGMKEISAAEEQKEQDELGATDL